MSVKIRLSRFGKNRSPHYRIVAIDERKARDGASLEQLGLYTPRGKTKELWIDLAKVEAWQAKGAHCSATVQLLVQQYKTQKKDPAPAV